MALLDREDGFSSWVMERVGTLGGVQILVSAADLWQDSVALDHCNASYFFYI